MKTKLLAVIVLVAAAGIFFTRAAAETEPATDPRLDKVIEQNEQILKNQEEMKQKLNRLSQDLLQLRRRSS